MALATLKAITPAARLIYPATLTRRRVEMEEDAFRRLLEEEEEEEWEEEERLYEMLSSKADQLTRAYAELVGRIREACRGCAFLKEDEDFNPYCAAQMPHIECLNEKRPLFNRLDEIVGDLNFLELFEQRMGH
jgi:hypothetical protein